MAQNKKIAGGGGGRCSENNVRKEENAGFPRCFQQADLSGLLKNLGFVEKGSCMSVTHYNNIIWFHKTHFASQPKSAENIMRITVKMLVTRICSSTHNVFEGTLH